MFNLGVTRSSLVLLSAAVLALAGCSTYDSGSSASSPEASSLSDAKQQARGQRDRHVNRAGSGQIAIGFGDHKSTAVTQAYPLPELQEQHTFLGTIPCALSASQCTALQFTLSLSPNGQWRMRLVESNPKSAEAKQVTSQGCWHQIGSEPSRILLETQRDTHLADLSFSSERRLKVNVFNYVAPTLETYLTRQPEVDPIDELSNQTGPNCGT